ncbi:MAG: hypothetical protein M3275_07795 [Thermoproteota archaeon]|nr:hypothetical protein [Thermoproteota archaeon]
MDSNMVEENSKIEFKRVYSTNKDSVYERLRVQRHREARGTKLCDCGCGELIPALTAQLKPARYKSGHNSRGKFKPDSICMRIKAQLLVLVSRLDRIEAELQTHVIVEKLEGLFF